MAKTRSNVGSSTSTVTADRAGRLYRLLKLLGKRPQTRDAVCATLGLTVRGFYRDLELLRASGIRIDLRETTYRLAGTFTAALELLPFPDPALTLAEAQALAKGRTAAHRKLKRQIETITH